MGLYKRIHSGHDIIKSNCLSLSSDNPQAEVPQLFLVVCLSQAEYIQKDDVSFSLKIRVRFCMFFCKRKYLQKSYEIAYRIYWFLPTRFGRIYSM
jgi:hypothetical protein